ncbi:HEPN domain-containing protein [Thalassotalea atypica]|uniref:HEPN domain-containing protein n=1 Tax=Thalassotalea atypica TaxID=2054316 RepID=UPI0025727369|nr:HEPN domain-containing protein [Thalassotalea atypica]
MFKESWLGYVFVEVDDSFFIDDIVLCEGVSLRKARLEELNLHLDHHLDGWWKLRGGNAKCFAYSRTITEGNHTKPLYDKKQWKQLVVECTNTNITPSQLNYVFSLSKADLRIGYVCFDKKSHSNPWTSWPQLGKWSENDPFTTKEKIRIEDLEELKININAFVNLNLQDDMHQKHLRLVHMFNYLDNMVDSSPFKYLGYFSIIEGILTHKPSGSDNVDSIQKQLIRNVKLINNRIVCSGRLGINYELFNTPKAKTIFSKLYSLRSSIAHGSDYEKSIGDILKIQTIKHDNKYGATRPLFYWIRDLAKSLLMYSFIEPQLYLDLTDDGK